MEFQMNSCQNRSKNLYSLFLKQMVDIITYLTALQEECKDNHNVFHNFLFIMYSYEWHLNRYGDMNSVSNS